MADETQTCPRRMHEFGGWKREEGLDRWETGRWTDDPAEAQRQVDEYAAKWPGGMMGSPLWPGPLPVARTCSFCGGVHPDDAMRLVRAGWRVEGTDKGYKRYLQPPEGSTPRYATPPVKLYTVHFSEEQRQAWNAEFTSC